MSGRNKAKAVAAVKRFRERSRQQVRAYIPHGTRSGYDMYACKCDACKEAKNAAGRKHYANCVSRPVPDGVEHGREATYNHYGCRCDSCRSANAEYRRGVRERRAKR